MVFSKIKGLSKTEKNLLLNMFGALFVKGLGLVISLFTMPAYIRFFNDDIVLGLWFTILSVLNWMLYFDFGIGNGLRNCLTKSLAEGDAVKAKQYISSAYVSIGALCILVSIVFLSFSWAINWHAVFNIDSFSVSRNALYKAVCIIFIGIIIQLFLRLINSVLYAIQKAAINNFLGLITSLLQVIALFTIPSSNNDNNLIIMAFVHLSAVAIPMLAATIFLFCKKHYRSIAPSIRCFKRVMAKEVLSLGGMFLLAQVFYMIIMNTNEYLITIFAGSAFVVDYQIYYRLFTLPGTLFVLVMAPLWSAVTKAFAERQYRWIKSLYHKILLVSLICIGGAFLIIPLAQPFVNVWLGSAAISMKVLYSVAFAVLSGVMTLNTVFSTFSNGIGDLKIHMVCFSIGAVVKIPLAYCLILLLNSWIGVVWANALALAIYCVVQPFFLKKYINKRG
jgi:O-antigen/teichoic acid export membrane protein